MNEPGRAAKHKHWFTALWWNFGPYGRQDVHVHSCIEDEPGDCERVVIGDGRNCKPDAPHHRETLA
jgi:hypothetical protein